jgi:hypothetical protein
MPLISHPALKVLMPRAFKLESLLESNCPEVKLRLFPQLLASIPGNGLKGI